VRVDAEVGAVDERSWWPREVRVVARVALESRDLPLVRLATVYCALVLVFALTAKNFMTANNFLNIGRASAVFGVAALGVTIAMIAGAVDVSFGAIMSVAAIVAAEQLSAGRGLVAALVIALSVGVALGILNGVLAGVLRLDSMIVTLGTLSIFGGFAFVHSRGAPVSAPGETFAHLGRGKWLGIPISLLIALGVAAVLGYVLRFTTFGQRCYVVGDNARAAALAGVHVRRVRATALAISGFTAAIGGMLVAANAGAANAGVGEPYLLSGIAAVVIGGTALSGGSGTIVGTVIGIAILGTIDDGLDLLQVSSFWQDFARGGIVVAALILDRLRRVEA
jgi:ribose/xylose/arabinose/galactoside ABC-type transport system permease subunit